MQLREIIDCCSELKIIEKRCISADFVDLVFINAEIAEWNRILTAFLGAPVKAEGEEPSDKDLKLTEDTGSIRVNQTLFEKEFKNESVIAKLWPWDDQIHTTLRMALLEK